MDYTPSRETRIHWYTFREREREKEREGGGGGDLDIKPTFYLGTYGGLALKSPSHHPSQHTSNTYKTRPIKVKLTVRHVFDLLTSWSGPIQSLRCQVCCAEANCLSWIRVDSRMVIYPCHRLTIEKGRIQSHTIHTLTQLRSVPFWKVCRVDLRKCRPSPTIEYPGRPPPPPKKK